MTYPLSMRIALTLLCLVLASLAACGDAGLSDESASSEDRWYDPIRPPAYELGDESLQSAEGDLIRHDVRSARQRYASALEGNDPFTAGTASAGLALTRLMLLPDEEPARALISRALKTRSSGYDVQRLLWANDGILDLFSQGARWEDDGVFFGVKTLVSDELPFEPERLEDAERFVQGLNEPVGTLSDSLVDLARLFDQIEGHLQRAINDPRFDYLYLPSQLFHDPSLAFTVDKSELALLHGALSVSRGALYAFAAYEHSWTLEQVITISPGGEPALRYEELDALWLRRLARQTLLTESKRGFQDGLDLFAQSISLGLERSPEQISELAVVRWDKLEREDLRRLREILSALSYSLDGPTKIPHLTEPLTVDLSVFFKGSGRTLPPEIAWFTYDAIDDRWRLAQEAEERFLLEGVFDPPRDAGQRSWPTIEFEQETSIEALLEELGASTTRRLETAYSL